MVPDWEFSYLKSPLILGLDLGVWKLPQDKKSQVFMSQAEISLTIHLG